MEYVEKRSYRRAMVSMPIRFATEKQPALEHGAMVLNLSEGNIFFQTDAALSIGEHITIQMSTVTQTISVRAMVIREDQKKYGCSFVDVNAEVSDRLRYLLLTRYEV